MLERRPSGAVPRPLVASFASFSGRTDDVPLGPPACLMALEGRRVDLAVVMELLGEADQAMTDVGFVGLHRAHAGLASDRPLHRNIKDRNEVVVVPRTGVDVRKPRLEKALHPPAGREALLVL